MRFELLASAIFGLANAVPVIDVGTTALMPRQDPNNVIYEAPDGLKNTEAMFEDKMINFGTIDPREVMQMLSDHCSGSGCDDAWTFETEIRVGDDVDPTKFQGTMNIQYDYPVWARQGLTEIHKIIMDQIMSVESQTEVVKWSTSVCGGMGFCQRQEEEITHHWGPRRINVRTKDGSMQLAWDVQLKSMEERPGACGLLTDLGAAIAGGLGGSAVGGAFGIGKFFCEVAG